MRVGGDAIPWASGALHRMRRVEMRRFSGRVVGSSQRGSPTHAIVDPASQKRFANSFDCRIGIVRSIVVVTTLQCEMTKQTSIFLSFSMQLP
jgi:hypothetical protein